MAIVMIAGPQIISAILLTMSVNPRRNSLSFIGGVALAITLGVTVFYVLAKELHRGTRSSDTGADDKILDYLVIALLIYLAIHVYRDRKRSEPPKWMGKLTTASAGFSFKLGFLLFLLMPTDIITMVAVGSTLAQRDESWWLSLPFILLTLLLVALPLLTLLVMGKHADALLPKARDWLKTNSWMVSELVILFFLVSTINDIT
ncbi:MAG: hypothetical protein HOQ05_07645 [Corynebacteriales bacterium]|nr:hypothetical protein [Mycobacteriales bacterium]